MGLTGDLTVTTTGHHTNPCPLRVVNLAISRVFELDGWGFSVQSEKDFYKNIIKFAGEKHREGLVSQRNSRTGVRYALKVKTHQPDNDTHDTFIEVSNLGGRWADSLKAL